MPLTAPSTSLSLLDCLRRSQPDSDAWKRFVKLYTPILYEWARRRGFGDADCADLTQQVLVKLLRKLPGYQPQADRSFRSWLFQVAKNQGHDFRRRRATRELPRADGLSDIADDERATFTEMQEAEYTQLLVHRALKLIRDDFEERTFRAFEACKLGGKTARDVATELGMSEGAVHVACHRVMTRLRGEIQGFVE
jgi:RNA polymerase sigma-70 factor (ECF subfamily)